MMQDMEVAMKTRYAVYVEDSGPGKPIADFLAAAGAVRVPDPHDPCDWRVPAAARRRIKEGLDARGADYKLFYEFEAESNDPPDQLVAFLGIDSLASEKSDSSAPIFSRDPYDSRVVVNRSMLELLMPLVEGLRWEAYGKSSDLLVLTDATELPDPLLIPNPGELQQLEGGLWDVEDDGRLIVTRRSVEHVNRHGIAYSRAFLVRGEVYPGRDLRVYGGRVANLVRSVAKSGASYLPDETFEIELW
jgi:hypothetical protein